MATIRSPDLRPARAAGLSGTETAVVYEQSMNTGFGQSCRGYVLLRYLGYPKVKILHGGYVAWTAAGLPTSTEVPTPAPKSFPIDPNAAGILVDLQSMKAAVADPNIVKLDTRDVDEWIADSSSPYGKDFCPRKGRIPGAVWLEWYRMMKPSPSGPMFKSREEILAECATVGVTPATPVVLYCFKGARASNTPASNSWSMRSHQQWRCTRTRLRKASPQRKPFWLTRARQIKRSSLRRSVRDWPCRPRAAATTSNRLRPDAARS